MKACIPKEISVRIKSQLEKGEIDADTIAKMLPEEKLALKSILESVVSEGLGVKVSPEEISKIGEMAKNIDATQKTLGNEIGNPTKLKENVDFFKAKKEMENYLLSKSPAHKLKVLTGTIGRGMMLFSVKSPVLNIGSNVEIGFAEALSRRISNFRLSGANNKLAVSYVKMVNKIYQKTGYDISRMTTITDTGVGGERVLGQTVHAQGKGLTRKVGRVIEDIVFKQLMGAPDVAFSSAHFADSVNLNSMKLAKGNKTKAGEIMLDSMRLEPQTPEGLILRTQGILDAQKATWTDTSWASRVSEGIRKILNDVSGDARAGDYLLPFIKTPANVIATGMDYAGMGVPKALYRTFKAFKSGDLGSKEYMHNVVRDLVRAGLGLTGAVIVASLLDDDDFVGAYDPARAQIESLRNSNENSIRIGGKWISTDWLGPLAVPVTAMMYARKYGKTNAERTFQYSKGVLASALNIPGVSDVYDTVKSSAYKKNQSLEEMTGATMDYISSQIYSRLIPSFFSDVSKAVDPNLRQSVKGIESIKSKVPFWSTTLPVKKNIFGEEMKGESALTDIFFGARVKTDKEDALVKEISTLSSDLGKGISFTDWDKSSSKQLAQFKSKVGEDKYNEAKIRYGKQLKVLLESEINKSSYKKLSDEDKLKIINNQDSIAMNKIFSMYRFTYKQVK
jgi:hypothetical protein